MDSKANNNRSYPNIADDGTHMLLDTCQTIIHIILLPTPNTHTKYTILHND